MIELKQHIIKNICSKLLKIPVAVVVRKAFL